MRINWEDFLNSNHDTFRSVGLYYKRIICVLTFLKSIELTNVVKYFELHSETSKIWHRNAFLYVSGCFLPDSEKGLQKRFFHRFLTARILLIITKIWLSLKVRFFYERT